jgi:hypothetical protein
MGNTGSNEQKAKQSRLLKWVTRVATSKKQTFPNSNMGNNEQKANIPKF